MNGTQTVAYAAITELYSLKNLEESSKHRWAEKSFEVAKRISENNPKCPSA